MNDIPRKRPARRSLLLVAAVLAALAIGFTIGVAHAADQRLDEAQLALQKAEALVEASQPGGVPEKAQRRFERHRGPRARPHREGDGADRRREGRGRQPVGRDSDEGGRNGGNQD